MAWKPKMVVIAVSLCVLAVVCPYDVDASLDDSEPGTATTGEGHAETGDDEFQREWDELIAAAQDEGELVILAGPDSVNQYGDFFEAFGEEFGINVTLNGGPTDEVTARILAERAQGIYSTDIGAPGGSGARIFREAGALKPVMEDIIHPEAVDRSEGWRVDYIPFHESDPEKLYILNYSLSAERNVQPFWYNTEDVTQEELDSIQSWQDLLDPQFEGRIVLGDAAEGQRAGDRTTTWLLLGEDYWDQMVRTMDVEVLPFGSGREFADTLARGDRDFGLFIPEVSALQDAQEQGLPVAEFPRSLAEGTLTELFGVLSIFDKAPHPNAAKLFVNWVQTREGGTAFNELTKFPGTLSLRSDVPQGNVPDDVWQRAADTTEIVDRNGEVFFAAHDESLQWWTDIFTELQIVPGS